MCIQPVFCAIPLRLGENRDLHLTTMLDLNVDLHSIHRQLRSDLNNDGHTGTRRTLSRPMLDDLADREIRRMP